MHVTVLRWFGEKGKIEIDYVIHESKKSSDWDGNQDEAYKAAFASKEQHKGVDGFGDELKLLLTNVLHGLQLVRYRRSPFVIKETDNSHC